MSEEKPVTGADTAAAKELTLIKFPFPKQEPILTLVFSQSKIIEDKTFSRDENIKIHSLFVK